MPHAIQDAAHAKASEFPSPRGQSLRQLATRVTGGLQVGLAQSVLAPGTDRLAFGIVDKNGHFLYGKTAVYVAKGLDVPAQGPYAAPADPMVTAREFESKTVANDSGAVKAIYSTHVPLPRVGTYGLLSVTAVNGRLLGGVTQVSVKRRSGVPAVGQRPPAISTDTIASAHGNLDAIDTRVPHDDMHKTDFKAVVGKRPVALLFATPQLCQSRTCGPVTDIALQMQRIYGKRMTFIHEEVYVGNNANRGYRPQLQAFHLQTEPWLFTIDRHGRIAARLEGAFGVNAFREAVQAALR